VRAELVSRLAGARLPRVEAVSFVRDERVPQMSGAEDVVAAAESGAAEVAGLVLNERGYERFAATSLDRVNVTLAATETFNRRNANASLDEAVARVQAVLARAERPSTATISCAFGCPFEGEVDPGAVADLCERLADAGELVLADTIGVATPRAVRRLVERVSILGKPVGFHGHNTRNTGYAAAWAALEGGATVLDASVGGLGGCPFSPQATGNVATEDLVWQLERDGVATGVDVAALVEISRWVAGILGRELDGNVYRARDWP
jgi:hydroxymethylglutaryl-CoA lyase/(R)-citramalyl-CoA lyase